VTQYCHGYAIDAKELEQKQSESIHNQRLVHLSDQSVDLVLTVTEITTLHEVTELAGTETTSWVGELEWPEEVGGLLEVWSNSEDLVDEILHADNAVLAEVGLDDGVVGKSNALLVDLSISTLVDELADGLEVWVTIGYPWLDNLQHLEGSLGHADKDTVVDLEKTEELKDFARLWSNLVDTMIILDGSLVCVETDAYPLIRTTKTSFSSAGM
jgi:hypothetical protein